jgi:branched-chain amino acid transport system permease protein
MIVFIQQVVNGLTFAGVYGLIAIGISLVFGMTGIINFAQGDLLMVGAYIALFVALKTDIVLGIVAATIALTVLGIGLYRGLFDWVRASPISGFIISIGLISVLENGMAEIASSNDRAYNSGMTSFAIGGVRLVTSNVIVLAVTVVAATVLLLVYSKTDFGRVVRVCVEDRDTAELLGISVRRVNTLVLGLAGAFAGAGGGLLLLLYPINPYTGSTLIFSAFTAALIGGLTKVQGAIVGALAVGLLTSMNNQYGPTAWTQLLVYVLLVVVLLIRPSGIFGT